jgi:predicted dehydrogenase
MSPVKCLLLTVVGQFGEKPTLSKIFINHNEALIMDKIKLAVVGAGNMATEHVKAFQDIVDVEIVAITSRNIGRATNLAGKFNIGSVCESVSEIYDKYKPDGVVIAVSELETHSVILEASRFPWSMLVEKPIGYNCEQAKAIFQLLEKRQDSIFVALNRRHYSSTRGVLKQLEGHNSSRVVVINDQEDTDSAVLDKRPQQIVENWMYANSIHLIDFFAIFCRGSLQEVNNIIPWRGAGTELILSELKYDSGDTGIYTSYWNRPHPWTVSISTKNKWWEIRPIEVASSISRESRTPVLLERSKWDFDFKPGLRAQAEEFVGHLKGVQYNLPNIKQSLTSMELVSKIYEI